MIVVDASAMLEVLLNTSASKQVLRRYASSGEMEPQRGLQALEDRADLPVLRYPHDLFLSRIWELRE